MFAPRQPSPWPSGHEAKAILARSAVAGFGLSAGRAFFRRGGRLLILAFVVCGTGYAVYDLMCTRKRAPISDWLIIAGSWLVCAYFLMLLGSIGIVLVLTMIIQGTSAGVGALLALRDRDALWHAQEIEAANLQFLDEAGFRDVGGQHGTVIDPYGNELILDDQRDDAFVFRIPGRRSVRGYIRLDEEGRMSHYDPPPGSGPMLSRPGIATAPASRNQAAHEELDNDAEAEESLSYPLRDDEAAALLERIDDKAYALLEALIADPHGSASGLPWEHVQEISGARDWSHFARGTMARLHRHLRDVTGDPAAMLLLDGNKFGWDQEDDDGPPIRVIFIQGPAVTALRRQLGLEG